MTVERKYIILANDDTGKEYAVIFDRDLSHQAVAQGIERAMAGNGWGPRMFLNAVSAGFIDSDGGVGSKGSESLKLEPRFGDEQLLAGGARPPLIVSAADGPMPYKRVSLKKPETRSFLERAKGAKGR